jgi:hypothetical protein
VSGHSPHPLPGLQICPKLSLYEVVIIDPRELSNYSARYKENCSPILRVDWKIIISIAPAALFWIVDMADRD